MSLHRRRQMAAHQYAARKFMWLIVTAALIAWALAFCGVAKAQERPFTAEQILAFADRLEATKALLKEIHDAQELSDTRLYRARREILFLTTSIDKIRKAAK